MPLRSEIYIHVMDLAAGHTAAFRIK
jgi:UDP-glucose 4-epimerase